MNTPQDPSSNESQPPSKPDASNGMSPGAEPSKERAERRGDDALLRKLNATIQRAERILAFGIAQENEHLRPSEAPRQRARACAEKGDHAGAEAAWREVIAAEEQAGEPAFISKAYLHFGCWLLHIEQDAAAFANSSRLVEVSRQAEFSFVLWKALEQRLICAMRLDLMAPAMEAAEEALRLAQGCEDLVEHRAWSHVLRGTCMLHFGEVTRADQDLEASREDLTDKPGAKLPEDSFTWRIRWWELTARVRMEQRDVPASVQAWERVVLMRRIHFQHRRDAWPLLFDALLDWADALRIDGRPDVAAAAEAEADRLEAEFDVAGVGDAQG